MKAMRAECLRAARGVSSSMGTANSLQHRCVPLYQSAVRSSSLSKRAGGIRPCGGFTFSSPQTLSPRVCEVQVYVSVGVLVCESSCVCDDLLVYLKICAFCVWVCASVGEVLCVHCWVCMCARGRVDGCWFV